MKKRWDNLDLKYTDATQIIRSIDVDGDIRVLVIGGDAGAYEWVIERAGNVEQHSDVGYGICDIALRDGLIAYYGLPDPLRRGTPTSIQGGVIEPIADERMRIERLIFEIEGSHARLRGLLLELLRLRKLADALRQHPRQQHPAVRRTIDALPRQVNRIGFEKIDAPELELGESMKLV